MSLTAGTISMGRYLVTFFLQIESFFIHYLLYTTAPRRDEVRMAADREIWAVTHTATIYL